jgi:hypothetical protein
MAGRRQQAAEPLHCRGRATGAQQSVHLQQRDSIRRASGCGNDLARGQKSLERLQLQGSPLGGGKRGVSEGDPREPCAAQPEPARVSLPAGTGQLQRCRVAEPCHAKGGLSMEKAGSTTARVKQQRALRCAGRLSNESARVSFPGETFK